MIAIIAEDKFGRHYYGMHFDGSSQRTPQPVPETIPATVDPNTVDILFSGDGRYQRFGAASHFPKPDGVAAQAITG